MDSPTSSMFGFRSNPVEDLVAKKKKSMIIPGVDTTGLPQGPQHMPHPVNPVAPLDNSASQGFGQYLSHLAHPNTMSPMNRQTNNGAGTGKSTEAAWRAEFPQAPGAPGWDAAAGMFGPHPQMPASPMALPTPTMPASPMTLPTPGINIGQHGTSAAPVSSMFGYRSTPGQAGAAGVPIGQMGPPAPFDPATMFGPQPAPPEVPFFEMGPMGQPSIHPIEGLKKAGKWLGQNMPYMGPTH